MNKNEKQSIKQMFKAKNEKWARNRTATLRQETLINKFNQLTAENKFYDLEYRDIPNAGLKNISVYRTEYAILEDTLYCVTRANGRLQNYEFLTRNKDGNFSYIQCKTFSVGIEDPYLTVSTAGFCIEMVHKKKNSYVCETFQFNHEHVWNLDNGLQTHGEEEQFALSVREKVVQSQNLFTAIKNTFSFQNLFFAGLENGDVHFGRAPKTFKSGGDINSSFCFKFDRNILEEPMTIYTPYTDEKFPTVTATSVLCYPIKLDYHGLGETMSHIEKTDMIDCPWMVENSLEASKSAKEPAEKDLA